MSQDRPVRRKFSPSDPAHVEEVNRNSLDYVLAKMEARFEAGDLKMDAQNVILKQILEQATKTNGRVNKAEHDILALQNGNALLVLQSTDPMEATFSFIRRWWGRILLIIGFILTPVLEGYFEHFFNHGK